MSAAEVETPPRFREDECAKIRFLIEAGVGFVWVCGGIDTGKSHVIKYSTRQIVKVTIETFKDNRQLQQLVSDAKRSGNSLIIESKSEPSGDFRYLFHIVTLKNYSLNELVCIGLELTDNRLHQTFLSRMTPNSLLYHNVSTPTMSTVLYFISAIEDNVEHVKPTIHTSTQEDAIELAVWLAKPPSLRSKTKRGKIRKRISNSSVRKNTIRAHSDVTTSITNVLAAQDNNFLRLSLRLNNFGPNYGAIRALRNSVAKGALEQTHAGFEPTAADPIRQSNRLNVREMLSVDDLPVQ